MVGCLLNSTAETPAVAAAASIGTARISLTAGTARCRMPEPPATVKSHPTCSHGFSSTQKDLCNKQFSRLSDKTATHGYDVEPPLNTRLKWAHARDRKIVL